MNELLRSVTSLPNLHPAVVHFPVALLPAALLFDLLALLARRPWLDRGASLLYALAALAAGGAYWAGEEAADSLAGVPPRTQLAIATHSDWALYTLWGVATVAVLRLAVGWRQRGGERGTRSASRWLLLAAGGVVLGLLLRTADLGGGLVYRHGVAVEAAGVAGPGSEAVPGATGEGTGETEGEPEEAAAAARQRLRKDEDGSLHWAPEAGDAAALGVVLTPAEGSATAAVSAVAPRPGETGLPLAVDGSALLLLPGSYGSVEVAAVLDLTGFDGTVGLAHHVRSAAAAGLFTVSTGGEAALVSVVDGERSVLEEASGEPAGARLRLAVSVAGRHLKGLVEGQTVVHAHQAPPPAGGCGLLLDGKGRVAVLSLDVTPLE